MCDAGVIRPYVVVAEARGVELQNGELKGTGKLLTKPTKHSLPRRSRTQAAALGLVEAGVCRRLLCPNSCHV